MKALSMAETAVKTGWKLDDSFIKEIYESQYGDMVVYVHVDGSIAEKHLVVDVDHQWDFDFRLGSDRTFDSRNKLELIYDSSDYVQFEDEYEDDYGDDDYEDEEVVTFPEVCYGHLPLSASGNSFKRIFMDDPVWNFEMSEDNSRADNGQSNLSMRAAHWKHEGFEGFMDDYGLFQYWV